MNHIAMLRKDESNKVLVESKEKQAVIAELTDNIWSYQEQNIFLSSNRDVILVEGRTDITYIQAAVEVLKGKYPAYKDLDFEFLPFGGASGLVLFIDKFKPNKGQTIIALLDRDKAGHDSIKEIFDFKGTMAEYKTKEKNGIYIALIPKTDKVTNDPFIIEDYFGINYLKAIMFGKAESYSNVLKDKGLKTELDRLCKNKEIAEAEFEGFRTLLDEIIKIQKVAKNVTI